MVGDEQIKDLITATLETTPSDATHWSTRSMATHLGLSQSMVSRVWRAFGLAPHKQDSWKLSKDPLFVEKVRDVVGLYLDPPERAVVSAYALICRLGYGLMCRSRRRDHGMFSPPVTRLRRSLSR